ALGTPVGNNSTFISVFIVIYGMIAVTQCTKSICEAPECSQVHRVLQVTWQRLYADESIENLATYSKRFGEQVNDPYRRKVIFTEASLSSTSITLKNVTWEDESCYICSFNVYPDGSKRRQICLKVQGISTEDGRTVVFSCSATGKPAPTIRWDYSSGASSIHQPHTDVVSNSDQTFTSSSSVTLKLQPDWNGHVDYKGSPLSAVALVITVIIVISCFAVVAVVMRKR
uniref:Ig-like domain-containing protein n=1 Tax=Acanthochromis polyacanthus TaxID=80966 RepID=A0A3Q1GIL7_9TELE